MGKTYKDSRNKGYGTKKDFRGRDSQVKESKKGK